MDVGTASADPDELATGYLRVTDLPTGGAERLPVVVAEGEEEGPTLWVTASIHGDEINGLAVAQDVMTDDLPGRLSGTVVCLPNLNPAGLRRNARTSYYRDDDPNRYFPEGDADDDRTRPPRVQELIDRRVYDAIVGDADAVLSLHTAQTDSRAFAIRGRVPYGERRTEAEAEALADELDRLVAAFGVPVINQYPQAEYRDQGLNRSLAGSLVDVAGVPTFTPELGGHSVVEEHQRRAGVTGTRNVMRAMGLLPGDPKPNEAAPEDPVDFPVCRARGPTTDTAGVVRYRVRPGDVVEPGTPVADVVTPHGDVKTTVEAERDGYVVSHLEGAAVYENDPLLSLAVRDEEGLVVDESEA
jgi:predicted deacylase